MSRLSERDRAAVHEAAHVLVGWFVGLNAKAVTVIDVQSYGNHHGATIVDIPFGTPPHAVLAMFAAGAVAEAEFFGNEDPNDWAEDSMAAAQYLVTVCGITDPAQQAEAFEGGKILAASLLAAKGPEWAAVAKALSNAGAMGSAELRKMAAEILILGRHITRT